MTFFFLDTSTKQSFLSFVKNGSVEKTSFLKGDFSLSKTLYPKLLEILPAENLSLLKALFVGLGPGSFTGTRVGVVLAKTLSYAKNIPLIGFSSLELAQKTSQEIVLLDAKSSGIYVYEKGIVKLYSEQAFLEKFSNPSLPFVSLDKAPILEKFPKISIEERAPNPLILLERQTPPPTFSLEKTASLEPIYLGNLK